MTEAAALKAQLDLHTRLFNNTLEGMTDEESGIRNTEHTNHMKWIAGHLLHTRLSSMARMAGITPDTTYGVHFERGASIDNNAVYPPIEELKAKWNEAAAAISEGMAAIPAESLAAPAPGQTPIADGTVRGLISFLMTHEALHIGQLSILRKLNGKEAMSFK